MRQKTGAGYNLLMKDWIGHIIEERRQAERELAETENQEDQMWIRRWLDLTEWIERDYIRLVDSRR
tara:strand:- start:233 stop:430 length:198 start_codon:yes stop_codon:yes gene_type:complete